MLAQLGAMTIPTGPGQLPTDPPMSPIMSLQAALNNCILKLRGMSAQYGQLAMVSVNGIVSTSMINSLKIVGAATGAVDPATLSYFYVQTYPAHITAALVTWLSAGRFVTKAQVVPADGGTYTPPILPIGPGDQPAIPPPLPLPPDQNPSPGTQVSVGVDPAAVAYDDGQASDTTVGYLALAVLGLGAAAFGAALVYRRRHHSP